MRLHEAAQAIGATPVGPDVEFTRVETDTRKLTPGCLFVALKGENFDGHSFAAKALEQGAAAVMVSSLPSPPGGGAGGEGATVTPPHALFPHPNPLLKGEGEKP